MPAVMRSVAAAALALLACAPLAAAQVTTDCNPLNTTKACPDDPAFGTEHTFNFNATPPSGTWTATAGTVSYDAKNYGQFTIAKQGDSPTIRSNFYVFFGRFEVWMKAAPGQGIISSLMLLSDDLDEIDWEILGANGTHAETNYFGKGKQDYLNAIYYPVNGGTTNDYHNYTIDWTETVLNYYIDGQNVRTLLPKDANNTQAYPQTPMRLNIGPWAAGDPREPIGTQQWAGGATDYSKGPFTMSIKSVAIKDYNKGTAYQYGDASGTFKSIKVLNQGQNSTAVATVNPAPEMSISQRFDALSSGAKIAVYACSAGVAGLLIFSAFYYIIRQRMRGAKEAKAAAARQIAERHEMERYKAAGIDPDAFADETPVWDAKTGTDVTTSPAHETAGGYFGNGEKLAVAGAGVAGGAAAAPLMRDGRTPPRTPVNDQPYNDHYSPVDGAGFSRSPAPVSNNYSGNANRSFSSPNPNMRRPGQAVGGYGQMDRTASPAPLSQPAPQRSFTGNSTQQRGGYNAPYGGNGQGRNDNWR